MPLLITPDRRSIPVSPAGKQFTLKELQDLVGGYIEVVAAISTRKKRMCLVVNEEGKLKGLPINAMATEKLDPRYGHDVIVGPAVFCSAHLIR